MKTPEEIAESIVEDIFDDLNAGCEELLKVDYVRKITAAIRTEREQTDVIPNEVSSFNFSPTLNKKILEVLQMLKKHTSKIKMPECPDTRKPCKINELTTKQSYYAQMANAAPKQIKAERPTGGVSDMPIESDSEVTLGMSNEACNALLDEQLLSQLQPVVVKLPKYKELIQLYESSYKPEAFTPYQSYSNGLEDYVYELRKLNPTIKWEEEK